MGPAGSCRCMRENSGYRRIEGEIEPGILRAGEEMVSQAMERTVTMIVLAFKMTGVSNDIIAYRVRNIFDLYIFSNELYPGRCLRDFNELNNLQEETKRCLAADIQQIQRFYNIQVVNCNTLSDDTCQEIRNWMTSTFDAKLKERAGDQSRELPEVSDGSPIHSETILSAILRQKVMQQNDLF